MKEIRTEIIIDASPSQVWKVLTDFPDYPNWNPFIVSIEGKGEVGARLTNILLSNGKENVFRPKVLQFEPHKVFEWRGSLPLGLFTGQHYFILEELSANQTKLLHGEKFGGLLRAMIMNKIGEQTQQNFLNMNRALKERAEQIA